VKFKDDLGKIPGEFSTGMFGLPFQRGVPGLVFVHFLRSRINKVKEVLNNVYFELDLNKVKVYI